MKKGINDDNIKKLRSQLKLDMSNELRIEKLNLLRYYLGLEEAEKEKVKYDEGSKELEYSDSIRISMYLIGEINKEIINSNDIEYQKKMLELLKSQYFYLARYLFEYYLVALEWGIPNEKQFIAPRTMVLNNIAKRLSRFYYRQDRAVLTLSMPQGTGKEQPLSSKILTPDGWITMGDVKVGTKVIGADGKACSVTGVYPKGIKDIYRVTFDDHSYVDCGLEHLWEVSTVEDRRARRVGHKTRIINTKMMLSNYILGKNSKTPYYNYSVRIVKPIHFENKLSKEDLKPYLLGALIGDGRLSRNCIKFTTADEEILKRVEKELPDDCKIKKYDGKKYDYAISNKKLEGNIHKQNEVFLKLQEYGLQGKTSEYKFIPKKYLYSSIENRIDLLRGLMDTNGWTGKKDCNCAFYTTSNQLKDDVTELIRSLGGKVSSTSKIGKYRNKNKEIKECKKIYSLNISININPFYLKRKANKYSIPIFNYQKMIVNIEKVRKEECQCIMINHPEHLYVTDGYTLTHNTEISKRFMSWAIGKDPNVPNIMVSYSAAIAKDKFFNGMDAIIDDDNGNYQRIFPKIKQILHDASTLSLDYRDDENRFKPHSEYTLYCCGFDGGLTGRTRARGILYLDDLVKDIEEATNKDIMDKKWVELTGTIKKRMQGNCKMLLVGTVFSINDPISRIIKYYTENDPERIEIIKIPGLNENEESNFNYKYGFAVTSDMFKEDRNLMDPVAFSCLIQQEPIESKGLVFFEDEFNKFDLGIYKEISKPKEYQRTIAAGDIAWGGDDHLSMPIIDEYENGECYLVDWYYINKESKDVTIPGVVERIIRYNISEIYFEANNGGDMYAEAVKEELKKKNFKCYVWTKKSPTNIAKKDRIMANQDSIIGKENADYRLIIPERKSIKNNVMMNQALNEVFKFREIEDSKKAKRQHDDAPDSLGMVFTQVLHCKKSYGVAKSNISREMLGI